MSNLDTLSDVRMPDFPVYFIVDATERNEAVFNQISEIIQTLLEHLRRNAKGLVNLRELIMYYGPRDITECLEKKSIASNVFSRSYNSFSDCVLTAFDRQHEMFQEYFPTIIAFAAHTPSSDYVEELSRYRTERAFLRASKWVIDITGKIPAGSFLPFVSNEEAVVSLQQVLQGDHVMNAITRLTECDCELMGDVLYEEDCSYDEKAENIIRVDPPLSIDDRPIRDAPDFQSCAQNNFIIKLDHKEIPLTEQIIVYRCQVQPSSIDKAKDIVATISFENGLISAIISDCDALKTIAFAIQGRTNRIVPKAAQYIFKVSSSEQPSLFEFIENAEDNSILVNNTANSVLTVLERVQTGSAIIMQDSDSICDKTGKVVLSIHKVEPAIVDDSDDLGGWGGEW